jgi:adenylate cyclase
VDVFERPPEFDPKVDAVVRAEVSRLRQNLKDYYTGPGQADRTVIDLPPRSYAPTITFPRPEPLPVRTEIPDPAVVPPTAQARPKWQYSLGLAAVLLGGVAAARLVPWKTATSRRSSRWWCCRFKTFLPIINPNIADGLTDEITNDLANLDNLRVIARTTAFEFKGKGVDIRDLGRQLNVEAALERSLVREGDRVRIRAQLNRTSDGYHLWSHAYDIDSHDLIGVQQKIAQSIADDMYLGQGQSAADGGRRATVYIGPRSSRSVLAWDGGLERQRRRIVRESRRLLSSRRR